MDCETPLTPMNGDLLPVLLTVRDLSVAFRLPGGEMTAVDRVSFDVAPGEVLGKARSCLR